MTPEQMTRGFNEWLRRYIEEPDQFEHEFQTVVDFLKEAGDGREPSYGDACTAYLTSLGVVSRPA